MHATMYTYENRIAFVVQPDRYCKGGLETTLYNHEITALLLPCISRITEISIVRYDDRQDVESLISDRIIARRDGWTNETL